MTREQDLERQLAEWLVEGPNTAPAEVVDQALSRTEGRRQWRGAWRLLVPPFARRDVRSTVSRAAGATVLAAVLAGVLLTGIVISGPLVRGPAPEMSAGAPRAVVGTATTDDTSGTPIALVRSIDLESDDPRIAGHARQELAVQVDAGDASQLHGTMRLETPWGDWQGPVEIVRYPSGEGYEYASLVGSDAYEGFTYLYTARQATAGAERTVEGAIWPDEPPSPPDPQLLP